MNVIVFPETEAISFISLVHLPYPCGSRTSPWQPEACRVESYGPDAFECNCHPGLCRIVHVPRHSIPLPHKRWARRGERYYTPVRRYRLPRSSRNLIQQNKLPGRKAACIGNRNRRRALLTVNSQILGGAIIGTRPCRRADDDNWLRIISIGAWINGRQDAIRCAVNHVRSRLCAVRLCSKLSCLRPSRAE